MTEILKVENLNVHFKRSSLLDLMRRKKLVTKAIDAVSFEVERGSCIGLVGESGCGKSTLSKAILRLIKPTSGSIFFENENIQELKGASLFDYRRRVQMIFQDPLGSLNPRLTAGEVLEEVFYVHGIRKSANRKILVHSLLDKVGLSRDVVDRRPGALSGGQCQRIGIARALAVDLLRDLRHDKGLTMIFVSHDLGVVRYLCDDIIVMNRGQIVERGGIDQIFDKSTNPYTRSLVESMPGLHRQDY
jgi:peptide/nickel transport system ATP-binding protein